MYGHTKIIHTSTLSFTNSDQNNLKFNITQEIHANISLLLPIILRTTQGFAIDIYTKLTSTDISIHFTCNQRIEHKKPLSCLF